MKQARLWHLPARKQDIEIIARAHYDDEVTYITERGANQVVMGEREITVLCWNCWKRHRRVKW